MAHPAHVRAGQPPRYHGTDTRKQAASSNRPPQCAHRPAIPANIRARPTMTHRTPLARFLPNSPVAFQVTLSRSFGFLDAGAPTRRVRCHRSAKRATRSAHASAQTSPYRRRPTPRITLPRAARRTPSQRGAQGERPITHDYVKLGRTRFTGPHTSRPLQPCRRRRRCPGVSRDVLDAPPTPTQRPRRVLPVFR